ncbi:hypothetical protein PTTG_28260 [Puccinia triticina 1-1 BBBD Race 1]|uniref:Uncharacterized protein n=1 Tax=Puccinia triticina (isolate 1-1 / race 1 (BBBD)) TaxID=630390 RepID=A0A180GDD4_PUCT1|nr:hypothetical protein PTTG_28260 [Puccinia triticina 1-1 BBBD Race 1]
MEEFVGNLTLLGNIITNQSSRGGGHSRSLIGSTLSAATGFATRLAALWVPSQPAKNSNRASWEPTIAMDGAQSHGKDHQHHHPDIPINKSSGDKHLTRTTATRCCTSLIQNYPEDSATAGSEDSSGYLNNSQASSAGRTPLKPRHKQP